MFKINAVHSSRTVPSIDLKLHEKRAGNDAKCGVISDKAVSALGWGWAGDGGEGVGLNVHGQQLRSCWDGQLT